MLKWQGASYSAASAPFLHLVLKVHMEDGSKGYAVLPLAKQTLQRHSSPDAPQGEVELVAERRSEVTLPLTKDGLPLIGMRGGQLRVTFGFHVHYRLFAPEAAWEADALGLTEWRSRVRALIEDVEGGVARVEASEGVEPAAEANAERKRDDEEEKEDGEDDEVGVRGTGEREAADEEAKGASEAATDAADVDLDLDVDAGSQRESAAEAGKADEATPRSDALPTSPESGGRSVMDAMRLAQAGDEASEELLASMSPEVRARAHRRGRIRASWQC